MLWIKALHIISVIAWMAGIFYLPRLFVYHVGASKEQSELFVIMERRLYGAIMGPAMVGAWLFGGLLVYYLWSGLALSGWFHFKVVLVLGMTALHFYLGVCRKRFVNGENQRGARFYRILNEVPTLLMIGIVLLVVVKPF